MAPTMLEVDRLRPEVGKPDRPENDVGKDDDVAKLLLNPDEKPPMPLDICGAWL